MVFQDHQQLRFLDPRHDAAQDVEIGDFRSFIRRSVAPEWPAIEFGPAYGPILPKHEGYSVHVVDHAPREALVEKYQSKVPDVSRIEEVDIIWHGGDLAGLLPRPDYTAIIASHFIEHAPDFLGFLKQCTHIMAQDGAIYLCVPDRHFCFDLFHPATTVGKILDDHRLARTRHSFPSFYNVASQILANGEVAWSQHPINDVQFISGTPTEWLVTVDEFVTSPTYVDQHENYFSPSSFALLIEELRFLGELELGIELVTRSRGCEFLVVLSKRAASARLSDEAFAELKMKLLLNMLREDAEQVAYLAPVFKKYGFPTTSEIQPSEETQARDEHAMKPRRRFASWLRRSSG